MFREVAQKRIQDQNQTIPQFSKVTPWQEVVHQ
jgi:hypothetical protein